MKADKQTSISVFVVSDLHASTNIGHKDQSWATYGTGDTHPFESLIDFVKNNSIQSDYLVCPGDLTHMRDTGGLSNSWEFLHRLKAEIGAEFVLPTIGNHDVDSRGLGEEVDPIEELKRLDPPFPISDRSQKDCFWANRFLIKETPNVRFLVVNSCGTHGARAMRDLSHKNEHEIGRICRADFETIIKDINTLPYRPINVLLCHHSPEIHSDFDLGEEDFIRGGQQLLTALETSETGDWIVIHGHKHHPRLRYASGGSCSPVVFSAGSVSVRLHRELHGVARNQVHQLTFEIEKSKMLGSLRGKIKSWTWSYGVNWRPANVGDGLPHECGFGSRDLAAIAVQLRRQLKKGVPTPLETLACSVGELENLTPGDKETLMRILSKNFNIATSTEMPIQLFKK